MKKKSIPLYILLFLFISGIIVVSTGLVIGITGHFKQRAEYNKMIEEGFWE